MQIHTDRVRSDGTIDDLDVETYYAPFSGIGVADDYIRVLADNGGTDIETRIPFSALTKLGWTQPTPKPSNE